MVLSGVEALMNGAIPKSMNWMPFEVVALSEA